MIALAIISFNMINKQVETADWVVHTDEVLTEIHYIENLVVDMETGLRGFLITGKDEFLEPYVDGNNLFEATITELMETVSDNNAQVERLKEIITLFAKWQGKAVQPGIALRKKINNQSIDSEKTIQSFIEQGTGKEIIDKFRIKINEFIRVENDLLVNRTKESKASARLLILTIIFGTIIAIVLGMIGALFVTRSLLRQIGGEPTDIANITEQIAEGKLDIEIEASTGIQASVVAMLESLKQNRERTRVQDWFKTGQVGLSGHMRGELNMPTLCKNVITYLCKYLGVQVGSFYLVDADGLLRMQASYAFTRRKDLTNEIKIGEGLVGQAALEKESIIISDVPEDYIDINSSLGSAVPRNMMVVPILQEDSVMGILEVGSFKLFSDEQIELLKLVNENIAIAINSRRDYEKTNALLNESTEKSLELEKQEERIRSIVESSISSIITIDARGIVDSFNVAAEKLFGYERKEVIGQNVKMLMPSPFHEEHDGYLHNYQTTGNKKIIGFDREVEARRKDGTTIPVNLSVGEMMLDGESYYIGTLQDISDQKEAEGLIQQQNEELKAANEELEEQTQALKSSEEELQAQGEELQQSNEELEQKSEFLERQKSEIEKQNSAIETSRQELMVKAEELEVSSKYKSEFLANMSHELRTPLNSLLILSKSLADNREGNLTEDQIESAGIVHSGGQELLELINDILDLSKVEAGKLSVHIETIALDELKDDLSSKFRRLTEKKGLELKLEIDSGVPETIQTDNQRAQQILKNLLSNAIKFTSQGSVTVKLHQPTSDIRFKNSALTNDKAIGISVTDTGIGIAADKQLAIFEAFQQADGSTSRQYGGTGLGLTISRELARLLGGEIQCQSEEGVGSTFTLYLPLDGTVAVDTEQTTARVKAGVSHQTQVPSSPVNTQIPIVTNAAGNETVFLADDRQIISPKDKSLLIIEDDRSFAKYLLQLARDKDYKCLSAGDGSSGLYLAQKYQPSGIILDLGLPDIDGLTVLDHLKHDLATRHIPVHIMSARDARTTSLQAGALDFLKKPATEEGINESLQKIEQILASDLKKLLVVEDDDANRKAIIKLLENKQIEITDVADGESAINTIKAEQFDCIILDMELPDMTGFDVLQKLKNENDIHLPPVIIHTGRDLSEDENKELNRYADSIVIKGAVSPERLLDETSLFLHSVAATMPKDQQEMIQMMHQPDQALNDKRILLVDDDVRNTFALSKKLREHGLDLVLADNGQLALEQLEKEANIDMVLMDIMMPVMDGHEAMQKIRQQTKYKDLPMIALTALAMPEDRAKCIDSGANDYLSKPVNIDKLLSMMRIWLYSSDKQERRKERRPWGDEDSGDGDNNDQANEGQSSVNSQHDSKDGGGRVVSGTTTEVERRLEPKPRVAPGAATEKKKQKRKTRKRKNTSS